MKVGPGPVGPCVVFPNYFATGISMTCESFFPLVLKSLSRIWVSHITWRLKGWGKYPAWYAGEGTHNIAIRKFRHRLHVSRSERVN